MYKIKCTNAQTMQLASSGQALIVVAPRCRRVVVRHCQLSVVVRHCRGLCWPALAFASLRCIIGRR
jgi:hypothetical protein